MSSRLFKKQQFFSPELEEAITSLSACLPESMSKEG
jgi:hypothetical protein